jgi:hypothetical protein
MPEPITLESLAARVAALERQLAGQHEPKKDWRSVVGMFDDDPGFMETVVAETLAIREAERAAARAESLE